MLGLFDYVHWIPDVLNIQNSPLFPQITLYLTENIFVLYISGIWGPFSVSNRPIFYAHRPQASLAASYLWTPFSRPGLLPINY